MVPIDEWPLASAFLRPMVEGRRIQQGSQNGWTCFPGGSVPGDLGRMRLSLELVFLVGFSWGKVDSQNGRFEDGSYQAVGQIA